MNTATIAQYIGLNSEIRFGKPALCGTRTTVSEVLKMLANGMSAGDIQENFPAITVAHVRACLATLTELRQLGPNPELKDPQLH